MTVLIGIATAFTWSIVLWFMLAGATIALNRIAPQSRRVRFAFLLAQGLVSGVILAVARLSLRDLVSTPSRAWHFTKQIERFADGDMP